jgi:hypothetical protein
VGELEELAADSKWHDAVFEVRNLNGQYFVTRTVHGLPVSFSGQCPYVRVGEAMRQGDEVEDGGVPEEPRDVRDDGRVFGFLRYLTGSRHNVIGGIPFVA